MDSIITFNKSFNQRLEEYSEVFDVHNRVSLQKCWSEYLQCTIDSAGWQAVWKIPRLTCESLWIPFPSFVLVFVVDVNFDRLTAIVRVLAVQDGIYIPEVHCVPLIELWCTNGQDRTIALNLPRTANTLDMLRFCYIHLLRPWDEQENTLTLASEHLEERLGLYYDLKNGSIPTAAAEYIQSLITQARHLENKKKFILSKNSDKDLEDECFEALKVIEMELLEIRPHIDAAENPGIRDVLIKRLTAATQKHLNDKPETWVIYDQGTVDSYKTFLKKVKEYYHSELLRFDTHLESKLIDSNRRINFVLNESKHLIQTSGILGEGGSILGIGIRENILLTSNTDDIMLDFSSGNVTIENITINSGKAQCALLIRRSKVILKHCKVIGDWHSSTQEGIIVFSEGELHLEDCEISGFYVAVVGNSNANITVKNCSFNTVDIGVKVFYDCKLNIQDSTIKDCREYGLVLETSEEEPERSVVGDFEMLNKFTGIQVSNILGSANGNGNAIIRKRAKLKPVEDLFSNKDFDPTIIEQHSAIMDIPLAGAEDTSI